MIRYTVDGQYVADFIVQDGRAIGHWKNVNPYPYGGDFNKPFNVKLRGKSGHCFQVGGDSFKRTFNL